MADKIKDKLKQKAYEEYGAMTYEEYYSKQVAPVIPDMKIKFKKIFTNRPFCSPEMLPVVG